MKELLLTKIEKDLTMNLITDNQKFFTEELKRYTENKDKILAEDYACYKEYEKQACYEEDIAFFNSMIETYDDMLANMKYDTVKKDYFLVNETYAELIYIRLEAVLDINEDYVRNAVSYEFSLDEIEYCKRIIRIYKKILKKIHDLELMKFDEETFTNYMNQEV